VKRDKKLSKSRGITLVALIITIILMLILVGVSIQVAINSDLIGTAEDAAQRTENAYISESTTGSLTIGDTEYSSIEEYLELLEYEQNMPEFVETIEDCKDTSKKYVLPDGYLYEYVPQKMATFTNLFDKDADGYIVDSYIKRHDKRPNLELIVFGKEEAMISKFNLNKLYNVENSYLQDRFGNLYPIVIKNDLMRIYNYKHRFFEDYKDYFELGINNIRFNILDNNDLNKVIVTLNNER